MQYLTKDYSVNPTKFASMGLSTITEWQSYTPTFSSPFGIVTEVDFKWQRNGSTAKIIGRCKTGSVASGIHTFSLPNGFTANCNQSFGDGSVVGRAVRGIIAQSNVFTLIANNTNLVSIGGNVSMSAPTHNPLVINSTTWFSSNEVVQFECELPIQQFQNSNQIVLGNEPVITNWTLLPPLSITGVTTNPTKGATNSEKGFWRRVGQNLEIRWEYSQTSGGTAGSGIYNINLPSQFKADLTQFGLVSQLGQATVGYGTISTNTQVSRVRATMFDESTIRLFRNDDTLNSYPVWGSGFFTFANNPLYVSFVASIPIQGWDQFNGFYSLETIVPQNLCKAWGRVSASGVLLNSYNISGITKVAVGVYNLTYSSPLADANPAISCTCHDGAIGYDNGSNNIRAAIAIRNTSGTLVDSVFHVQVFGN